MLPVGAGRMSKIPLVPPPQPESCRRSPPLFQPADKTLHGVQRCPCSAATCIRRHQRPWAECQRDHVGGGTQVFELTKRHSYLS